MKQEIRLIESFKTPAITVSAGRGDSFWKLAKSYYNAPYLHQALSFANGRPPKKPNHIKTGESIVIPPLYKLSLFENTYIVRPGDTATKVCRGIIKGPIGRCLAQLRVANPQINLNRLYALQPLRLPQPAPLAANVGLLPEGEGIGVLRLRDSTHIVGPASVDSIG
ncbi:hypothetical protein I6F29_36035 [Bradyrhizobium sp. NBAIM16]|uniref:hypothetical protein n=1 Tax=Bradyrhizobium sp. NBAIM16 TaxID=2793813 RepID=UPI001CD2FDCD|nr:hypothetical protein [Bradyrhizobium sp. NBAIM16]MCA1431259.1 hypothetical protein [Bradyrhizobium sp. NBAIM16]